MACLGLVFNPRYDGRLAGPAVGARFFCLLTFGFACVIFVV